MRGGGAVGLRGTEAGCGGAEMRGLSSRCRDSRRAALSILRVLFCFLQVEDYSLSHIFFS